MIVTYNKPNTYTAYAKDGQSFLFIPGTNNVPNNLWDEFNKNPHFQADVKGGVFKVETKGLPSPSPSPGGQGRESPESSDEAPALAEVDDTSDALRIVKNTFEVATLRQLKRNETRPEVLTAIDEQMGKLRTGNRRGQEGE